MDSLSGIYSLCQSPFYLKLRQTNATDSNHLNGHAFSAALCNYSPVPNTRHCIVLLEQFFHQTINFRKYETCLPIWINLYSILAALIWIPLLKEDNLAPFAL